MDKDKLDHIANRIKEGNIDIYNDKVEDIWKKLISTGNYGNVNENISKEEAEKIIKEHENRFNK